MPRSVFFMAVFIFFWCADGLSFRRYKSLNEFLSEGRSNLTAAPTTVPRSTVNYGMDRMSYNLFTMIKSEFKTIWSKVSLFNDCIELVVGAVISSIMGTLCFFLFKFIRNNYTCKSAWFICKCVNYNRRHEVTQGDYEQPIELTVMSSPTEQVV